MVLLVAAPQHFAPRGLCDCQFGDWIGNGGSRTRIVRAVKAKGLHYCECILKLYVLWSLLIGSLRTVFLAMSAAGGGSVSIAQVVNMTIVQLKVALDNAGVRYVPGSSKSALQQLLIAHLESMMQRAKIAEMQQLQQRNVAELQQIQQRQEAELRDAYGEDHDPFTCSICCEQFSAEGLGLDGSCKIPRNLMCGHTICTGCLQGMYNQLNKPKPHNIICPFCKKDTPFPAPDRIDVEAAPVDAVSQHLSKNFLCLQVSDFLNSQPNLSQ